MDEATIKAREEVSKILSIYPHGIGRGGESLERLVCCIATMTRAAYADGLDAAAKLVDSHAGELTREMCDGCGNEDDVATGAMNDQARDIAAEIRQHAKEMGHE